MKKYKCNVCGKEYYLKNKEVIDNLKNYGEELPVDDCHEDDNGKLIEVDKWDDKKNKLKEQEK